MQTKRLGFIGGGNMAEALVKGLIHAKVVPPQGIVVSDVDDARLAHVAKAHGVRTTRDNHELVRGSDVIVLSVKPQVIDKVLALIGGDVTSKQLVISVAAGVPIAALEARLPDGTHVVRAMPNTPATVQAARRRSPPGHTRPTRTSTSRALCSKPSAASSHSTRRCSTRSRLSGSGPAYVMLMIEALADGGVKVGLHRDTALLLAAQTVYGSAKLLLDTGEHPGRLKDMVTSPAAPPSPGCTRSNRAACGGRSSTPSRSRRTGPRSSAPSWRPR